MAKVAERAGWGGEDGKTTRKDGANKEKPYLPPPLITRWLSPTHPGYGGCRGRGRMCCMGVMG